MSVLKIRYSNYDQTTIDNHTLENSQFLILRNKESTGTYSNSFRAPITNFCGVCFNMIEDGRWVFSTSSYKRMLICLSCVEPVRAAVNSYGKISLGSEICREEDSRYYSQADLNNIEDYNLVLGTNCYLCNEALIYPDFSGTIGTIRSPKAIIFGDNVFFRHSEDNIRKVVSYNTTPLLCRTSLRG